MGLVILMSTKWKSKMMIMERQVILKETHLEVMCRFQHLTFNYTAQITMEGTEFYDVTFAVEDDKEISIVLELNPENSAAVVIDEVLEATRDTLARHEVEGSMLPRLLLKRMLVKILSSTK